MDMFEEKKKKKFCGVDYLGYPLGSCIVYA